MALLAASSSLTCLSLRCTQASASAPSGTHSSRIAAVTPVCTPLLTTPAAAVQSGPINVELGGSALAGALFAALASTDSAMAAQEMMNLAAAVDNRGLGLLLTLVPAVGWVLFNILQPALSQIDRMKSAKGLALGLGLGAAASLLIPPHADAAVQEIATLAADNDARGLLLLIVLAPAVGWVLFNILKPALNQLDRMNAAKGVLGAVGLSSAALLCTPQADAAVQEMSSLADGMATASSDARGLLLLLVLAPAVGWVLFNILKPALSQLDRMKAAKGIVGAAGLSGAMLFYGAQADAAVQEVTSLADSIEPASSDARGLLLLAALVPALGWVLFNILQPALNQFDRMKASKGIAAAVGLGAAAALLPLRAEALQEIATVADNDSRGTLLLAVLIPAVAWVLFNILQPALNQFDKMKAQK